MDKPIRVLFTKQLSKQIINRFFDSHFEIISCPFIDIVYDIVDKEKICKLLQEHIDIIITSQNVVQSLLENFGAEMLAKATWKIYCIGFATKDKIQTYFIQSTIICTAKDIRNLSDKIILLDKDKFYFLGSNIRQQYWIDKLHKHYKKVEEYWIYHTVLKPQKIDCKNYQAIVFLSPSAVDSFFLENHISEHIQLFAIGNTTAKTISKYINYHVLVPSNPTVKDLLDRMRWYFKSNK
ncbi:MAG: uroporphyrinogen-III synthase [Chitinophagaceae bacterium]